MHEHILCDLRNPELRGKQDDAPPITLKNRFQIDYFQNRLPANMFLDDDETAVEELLAFHAVGGGTIVDVTTGGMAPQPARLADLSKRSEISIVMGAGYYVEAYIPATARSMDLDQLEEVIRSQLTDGTWGTTVKAGVIGEIGCSWPLAPIERVMLQAAAKVQRSTGAAITIHPGRHRDAPVEIADILTAAGADPSRTVIGHMDRTIFDRVRLLALLKRGFILEWDFFGIETSQYWMAGEDLDLPTDYMRLDLIEDLFTRGFSTQIAISHDICTRTRLCSYGGHGYGHLLRNIVPMMRRRGWGEPDIEQLLKKTPMRLLCYLTGPAPDTTSPPHRTSTQ